MSFWVVIALWLAASGGLWWFYRRHREKTFSRETELARRAKAQVEAAQGVFDVIRHRTTDAATTGGVKAETHALLQRIQGQAAFFDAVNVLHAQIRRIHPDTSCPALGELLHIRRDLWAASEIVLMEDVSVLGDDFAEAVVYERFRDEAIAVLFVSPKRRNDDDLINLRLSLAREEAARFVADAEEAARLAREQDRLPTPAEVAALTLATVRAVPERVRAARARIAAFHATVAALAARIRESRGVTEGLAELRRVREALPGRVTAGAARASGLARQSAAQLKQHYDFLVTAHDLQARYAAAMRKRPEISASARQFIARLDLAARSERLRLTSASWIEWARGHLVVGLAHLMAALPRWQARLDEARAETARAASDRPLLPFALQWPPPDDDNKREE